jgi:cupin 2 domain-containing protein
MQPNNIMESLPSDRTAEVFEQIVDCRTVRIERIISNGHISPEHGWYDQDENEWVMVIKGSACLEFEDGTHCHLSPGDYINILAHTKHKVTYTDKNDTTIWLAVFYR